MLPFTASVNGNPFLIATGASFGAYHAMSFATRYPDLVGRVVAMSGLYDITLMTDGYTDGSVYFHNPCAFLLHEHDPARLDCAPGDGHHHRNRTGGLLCWNSEQLSEILWEQRHRQRAQAVGRLGPRLAMVAADDPDITSVGMIDPPHGTRGDMSTKIGLLVGREWSFPPAFIDEVARRDAGVIAEYVRLGAPAMDEPCPYRVSIDRISHEVPFYRTCLKHAVLSGATVVNNPFMWSADDKFFGATLATSLGVASPQTVVLPNKAYVPGINHDESLRNLTYPLDWEGLLALRRAPLRPQGCPRRRLAERLRLPQPRRS